MSDIYGGYRRLRFDRPHRARELIGCNLVQHYGATET